ncbi:FeS-binding protein [Nostoc minutum NIES-26]|uniref:FeS-binding protein n=1 Tax=Nostoc minutum NIES-26 TaxID=1844469 RepID=A0A367QUK6_9NOSO|nr:FeS-binding protein [Nostoc minutum NIES-26]
MTTTVNISSTNPSGIPHTLFVCTTCASVWQDGKRQGESGGQKLLQHLQQLAQNWNLREEFPIQEVECMSACNRYCVVAFAAQGKLTYLFGDLATDGSASAVLQCASQYYAKSDGLLPWLERPEPLKKGILAKIPPLVRSTKVEG